MVVDDASDDREYKEGGDALYTMVALYVIRFDPLTRYFLLCNSVSYTVPSTLRFFLLYDPFPNTFLPFLRSYSLYKLFVAVSSSL